MATIPKVIHYCWFGRNPLPASAKKCIASWHKFFPNYEIKEWNEDNFDIHTIPYTQDAYDAKKYAFVSDYARFWILYHYGGIYFDTDVEVIHPMDDIIQKGPFMGFEVDPIANNKNGAVAPGLGLGVNPGLGLYKELLDYYQSLKFETGTKSVTVVKHTTQILLKHGLKQSSGIQIIDGIYIYPSEYFNPFDDGTGKLNITPNTRTIHWYSKTWIEHRIRLRIPVTRFIHRLIGTGFTGKIRKYLERILKLKI